MAEEEKAEKEKAQRMTVELMSGSRLRLPPLALIVIDDFADLISILGREDDGIKEFQGMSYAVTPDQKIDITLNQPGTLPIEGAIDMAHKYFVKRLLWASTKVLGDIRELRRIEINQYQCHEPTMVMSDYISIQGWTFETIPRYAMERMQIGESKYTRAIEKALKDGRITNEQLEKVMREKGMLGEDIEYYKWGQDE